MTTAQEKAAAESMTAWIEEDDNFELARADVLRAADVEPMRGIQEVAIRICALGGDLHVAELVALSMRIYAEGWVRGWTVRDGEAES